MFTAKKEGGGIIHITSVSRGSDERYYCPGCGKELVVKRLQNGTSFFAHKAYSSCAYSDDESQWRKRWLSLIDGDKNFTVRHVFPYETPYMRELGFKKDVEYSYPADVRAGGCVVMLMPGALSKREFQRQNYFFSNAGYRIVWIMDLAGYCRDMKIGIEKEMEGDNGPVTVYRLKTPPNTFTGSYVPSKKVSLYFEAVHGIWEKYSQKWERDRIFEHFDEPFLIRMIWGKKDEKGRIASVGRFYGADAAVRDLTAARTS